MKAAGPPATQLQRRGFDNLPGQAGPLAAEFVAEYPDAEPKHKAK